jgi:hypothetical protein
MASVIDTAAPPEAAAALGEEAAATGLLVGAAGLVALAAPPPVPTVGCVALPDVDPELDEPLHAAVARIAIAPSTR